MKLKLNAIIDKTWKGAIITIALILLANGLYSVIEAYHEKYSVWEVEQALSKDIEVVVYQNCDYRVRNRASHRFTTPRLRYVSTRPERDTLTVFKRKSDGKRGYLSTLSGQITIQPQYDKAWHFSEGRGCCLIGNMVNVIDSDGRVIFETPYIKGATYLFRDGFLVVPIADASGRRYSVYDRHGRRILEGWAGISDPDENGYRVVADTDGYWLYNWRFEKVFTEPYDNMSLARSMNAVYRTKNYVKQLVSLEDGLILESFVIDGIEPLTTLKSDEYGDQYAIDDNELLVYSVDGRVGLMRAATAEILTPAKYYVIKGIENSDLIRAVIDKDKGSAVILRRHELMKK